MLEECGFLLWGLGFFGLVGFFCLFFFFSLELLALPELSVTITDKQHAGMHGTWLKVVRKTHGISNHFSSFCGAAGGSSPSVS